MFHRSTRMLSCAVLLPGLMLGILSAGCLDDNPGVPAPEQSGPVTLSTFEPLVGGFAPPAYGQSRVFALPDAMSDSTSDPWSSGDRPILGQVFGTVEPFSLYASLRTLDVCVRAANAALAHGDGTVQVEAPDGNTYAATVRIVDLTAPVSVPDGCSVALGSDALTLDRCVIVTLPDQGARVQVGFRKTASDETVLVHLRGTKTEQGQTAVETAIWLAQRNPPTGAVSVRGSFHKSLADGTSVRWVYGIQTETGSGFRYRVSWSTRDLSGLEGLATVVGGGTRDDKFVLHFRRYVPCTESTPDPADPAADLTEGFGTGYRRVAVSITDPVRVYAAQEPFRCGETAPSLLGTPFGTLD